MTVLGEADRRHRVTLTGVSKSYPGDDGPTQVLAPTDLTLESGEFVCVVGPSGCGKSTLLNLLAGFLEPSEGTIRVGDRPVLGPDPERGVVFQQPNLYPWLSVRQNVEFGPKVRGVPKARRAAEAERMLTLVGLDHLGGRRPYELSGGQQQRAQIARVLVNDPQIILMDEPFGALDALTRERLQGELRTLWRDRRKTVFFVTHSIDEALLLGTRVLVMGTRPGRVIYDQPTSFKADLVEPGFAAIRDRAGFATMRDEVSAQIYAAHE
ncbi:ABC transporter ATP-binding protein [Nocardia vulneris]|uniref:Taurine ABC transporter ATP-binding protein n=1 Tax=Nocardia vulneris TaxID=1141657 RepID=A0ABR4Z7Y2_9NOCA|nr:ABC transporter ATP-binding protein [Nocardia vulneris]KIA61447.1 taurine ABC transporter ATP-binding protein [Nocardia vulneris]